eukprot:g17271.t1
MWEIESQNETVCCQPAAEDMADLGVRSAGFADGNEAVFFANGVEFYHAPARGLTLVLVRPDGTRKDSQTFDTMLNDNSSENLVAFIDSIPDGTIVLVGARDEASIHLSLAAKEAIKSLGATMTRGTQWSCQSIDQLSFRASYALVGVKNGAKLSESLRKTTEGYAVAVGQMKVVISVDANKPLCDTSAPTPAVSGYVSQGNLNLDAGCRYNLFEASHATQCMQGSWIMMTGSSNTLLEFGNLINFLAPDEYAIDRAGEMIGASAVADVVIEEGKVTHWATVSNQLPECRQVDASLAQQNRPACKQAIEALFAQAPAYSSSGVRITMFISFFWYRTELALELIAEDALWSAARVGVVTQYCPRKELLDMDRDPAIQVFKDEMEVVLAQMDSFCTTGRASQLGCYVQTISWTNGVRDNENFQVMNGYIEEAMAGRLSSSFRLVDFFKLGGAMPEEVVQGHGSQMLNLWVWQVMFNAMCPAELAASGTYAVWEGNLCSGTEARFENCPNYYPSCLNGPRCEKWECMNSVPCTFRATDPPMAGNSAGLCDDAINISSFLADQPEAEVQMLADGCHNSRGLRVRLWTSKSAKTAASRAASRAAEEDFADVLDESAPAVLARSKSHITLKSEAPKSEAADAKSVKSARSGVGNAPQPSEDDLTNEPETCNAFPEPVKPVTQPEPVAETRVEAERKEPVKQINIRAAGNKYPLGLARFMGSTHVVVGHLFAKGVTSPTYFFGWGFTWVPWFFMLSGFVLFSAYLKNPKEETMIQYVLRRSTTIYPLYAFSLIPAFILGKAYGTMAAEWPTLLAQSFLLQAWVPHFTENALQMHCWFLSCMVVLLPFQAMILFGLAGLPSLPLPYFSYMFSKMDFLENYSYCVYVFQFLCYAIWPQTGLVNLFWYIIYTYATAFLLARLIQQPIQKWWAAHTKARLVVPFVLGTFLVGFSFLPDPAYDNSLPDLPASIMIDNRTVDVRLNLEDPEGRLRGAMVINPSLLIQDGQILVAARRHRRETLQRNGIYHGPEGSGDAVIIDQIWHSEILLGSKAIDADAWKKWPTGGSSPMEPWRNQLRNLRGTMWEAFWGRYADMSMSAWSGLRTPQGKEWTELCVVETWIPSNSTVIRHIVTGPFRMVTLAFDSKPPHGGDESTMYMAQGVNIEEPGNPMVGYRLTYGQTDVAEKNWIPFTYKDSVYFIYTPSPHVIVSTQMDGTSEKVYSTTFRPLQRITQESPHVQIRGSAQAVFVNNSQATPSLARPHYLALLHLYDVSTGRYAHHAYRFGAEPPFMTLGSLVKAMEKDGEATANRETADQVMAPEIGMPGHW